MIFQDLNKNIQNNEQDFFDSPYTTIVKTFAMFVGELDFEDIPINPAKTFSVVSYAFFLIFVLMMVVILMNLLNGLAVADVGEIVRDAKVVSIKSRWQHWHEKNTLKRQHCQHIKKFRVKTISYLEDRNSQEGTKDNW